MEQRADVPEGLRRDGHRLLRAGGLLFLLGLLVGLAVPIFPVPRLGLSTHLLGIMQGAVLLIVGLLWPRLALTRTASRIGHGLGIYGCASAFSANLLGAMWGAGSSMLPLAAGAARGSALQEGAIRVLLVSAAVSLIALALVVLWGLRLSPSPGAKRVPGETVETIATARAPKAVGPYAQATRAQGVIFCAGQGAFDPATGRLVEGGIQAQTRQVLRNIQAILEAGGSGLHRVVKVTVFLSDWRHFKEMNEAYAEFFGTDHPPARSTVQGERWPEGHLVAMEAIALAE